MNWYNKQIDIDNLDFIIDSFLFDNKIEKTAQLVSPRLLPNFIKWRDKGYSPEQLGKKFKISPKQVNQILKRYDASHKDPVFMDKKKEQRILQEVQKFRDNGKQVSVLGIANKLNIPKDVVQYVINKNNITDIKGRRETISPEVRDTIIEIAQEYKNNNIKFSFPDIINEVTRRTGAKISFQTVMRLLYPLGMKDNMKDISEQASQRWQSQEYRDKVREPMRDALKKRWQNQERRDNYGKKMKEWWNNNPAIKEEFSRRKIQWWENYPGGFDAWIQTFPSQKRQEIFNAIQKQYPQ